MNDGPGLDLGQPRDVGALLRDGLRLYAAHLPLLLLMAAAIVVPFQLVVSGIGLEQLTAAYDDDTSVAERGIPTILTFFVTTPLVTAATIHALTALANGSQPRAGTALQAALDVFTPLLAALLLAAAGILLGLLALILPGVYLLIRWYFVPQAVVVDGGRAVAALRRSGALVQDFWWRTFAIVLLLNLVAAVPGLLILTPLEAAAESADREVVALVGSIAAEVVSVPFVAVVSTLLFFDLRARHAALPPLEAA